MVKSIPQIVWLTLAAGVTAALAAPTRIAALSWDIQERDQILEELNARNIDDYAPLFERDAYELEARTPAHGSRRKIPNMPTTPAPVPTPEQIAEKQAADLRTEKRRGRGPETFNRAFERGKFPEIVKSPVVKNTLGPPRNRPLPPPPGPAVYIPPPTFVAARKDKERVSKQNPSSGRVLPTPPRNGPSQGPRRRDFDEDSLVQRDFGRELELYERDFDEDLFGRDDDEELFAREYEFDELD